MRVESSEALIVELQHLRTLIAVADAGSLTRAAESLALSQPAVSAQIRTLEAGLGLPLFHRAARGMRLTDAGRELLGSARRVVQQADGFAQLADRLRGRGPASLRLGTIDCGFDLKLARIVGLTTRQHPQLEVQLVAGNSGQHIRALLDHELDVIFAEGDFDDPRLQSRGVGSSRLGIVGPWAWRERMAEADWPTLAEMPWIFQSRSCSHYVLLERLIREHDLDLRPQLRAEAFGEVKELVAEGLGLSICDLDDAEPLIRGGRLVVWPGFEHEMPLRLWTLATRADEPAIRCLAEASDAVHGGATRRRSAPPAAAVVDRGA